MSHARDMLIIPSFLKCECFTIHRRLLFTADPQYPAVALSAKLPNLVLHINEHKVWVILRVTSYNDTENNNQLFSGNVFIEAILLPKG